MFALGLIQLVAWCRAAFWPVMIEMRNVQTKKRTVIDSSTQMLNMALYTNKRTGKKRPNFTDKQFTTDALAGKR